MHFMMKKQPNIISNLRIKTENFDSESNQIHSQTIEIIDEKLIYMEKCRVLL